MATGETKTTPEEIDLSEEEQQALIEAFSKLGTKPKIKDPQALKEWLMKFAEATTTQEKPDVKPDVSNIPAAPVPTTAANDQNANTPASVSATQTTSGSKHESTVYTPRISIFYGEPGKGEAPYDLWRYEVDSLRKSKFQPHIIDMAIRRSLKGDAARVAMRLGPDASLEFLLAKLETTYGLSIQNDRLMAEFYSAKQKPEEDVTAWANRLEDLLYKAGQRHLISPPERNEKLCSMFWSGLKKELKDISGHLHYIIKDFDTLKKEMRELESDVQREVKTATAKMMSTKEPSQDQPEKDLTAIIQQMAADIQSLKDDRNRPQQQKPRSSWRGTGNRPYRSTNRYREQGRGQYQRSEGYQTTRNNLPPPVERRQHNSNEPRPEIVCWRCGQTGHVKLGCRVRMDHSKKELNHQGSA